MSQEHNHSAHSHDHSHSHAHNHTPNNKRILAWSFAIITAFMGVEYVAGYAFNSLALMADAGHMLNDAISLGLALLALSLATRRPNLSKWLAVINGASLIVIAISIIWEAFDRLQNPTEMVALPMIAVATLGLIVNIIVAKMMMSSDHDNLNIKAAYLHVLADMFGSVVAIIAGLSAYFLNWQWVDPVASFILSVIILRSGISVTKAAVQALKSGDELEIHTHNH